MVRTGFRACLQGSRWVSTTTRVLYGGLNMENRVVGCMILHVCREEWEIVNTGGK